MKLLAIITPTYNRKRKLINLYKSLKNQKNKNFIWYVIDDGSTDKTDSFISGLQEKHQIDIKYFKKKNGGKHKALNYIIPKVNTLLSLVIDSDDYLIKDGVDIIQNYWNGNKNIKHLGSLIFQRADNEGKPLRTIKNKKIGYRYYENVKNHEYGDYSDVFITSKLKKFKFPEIKGEKFLSEGILYYRFSQKYKSVYLPKTLIIGGYQKGGLTNNIRKLQLKNYKGTLLETNMYLRKDTPFYFRIKKSILYDYIAYGSEANLCDYLKKSNSKYLTYFLLPIGICIYKKDSLKNER